MPHIADFTQNIAISLQGAVLFSFGRIIRTLPINGIHAALRTPSAVRKNEAVHVKF